MQLHYRSVGDGDTTLIILHGLFGMSDNWMTLAKQLGEKHRVIVVDARNHGASPHHDEWNYKVMADDVVELIQDLELYQPVVLGHSMGGKTAIRIAVKYPHLISKLIVADMSPRFYPLHHQHIIEALEYVKPELLSSRKEAETKLSERILDPGIRLFLLKNLTRDDQNNFRWKFNLPVIVNNIMEVGEEVVIKEPVEVPALFIKGGLSDYVTYSDMEDIKTQFSNVEIQTIDGAGHWVHADKPVEFFTLVDEFIS